MRLLRPRTNGAPARELASAPLASRPVLVVRPEPLRTILAAAGDAGELETGGPLFGTVFRSWVGDRLAPVVSVLGTVRPGPGVRGDFASVSLGEDTDGDRAASALRWLRSTTGLDLVHVGDWHVHPRGLCQPSRGDVKTALALRAERGTHCCIVGIASSRTSVDEDLCAEKEAVVWTEERFEAAELGFFQTVGQALVPVRLVIEDVALPRLPPLPWHIADPVRLAAEVRLLDAAGFRTALAAATGDQPGLSMRLQRDGGRTLEVRTGLYYPHEQPLLFAENGSRLVPRSAWSRDRFLVDVVREISP